MKKTPKSKNATTTLPYAQSVAGWYQNQIISKFPYIPMPTSCCNPAPRGMSVFYVKNRNITKDNLMSRIYFFFNAFNFDMFIWNSYSADNKS